MLPDPTLILTLPSLHDGLLLDCRIYHPREPPREPHQQHHAAVLAHPYAPMGGCYDDPVVSLVGEQLLDLGFLLGTFNFRGARGSAGRTSWTARPERDDYSSFIGFMVYYLHHLHSPSFPSSSSSPPPILLIGGYSYGAMITSHLPPLPHLLAPFHYPSSSSHAAQIRLRAASLAASIPSTPTAGNLPALEDLVIPAPAYLLISPLKGLSTRLTTMSIPFVDAWRNKGEDEDDKKKKEEEEEDAKAKLAQCPSLAVYGDCDVFVPVGKLRSWAQDLAARQHSQFRHCEIQSAGHFWSEEGVLCRMMDSIDEFAGQLFDSQRFTA